MVFNLPFENVIYQPITNNNCTNVAPPVLFLYTDTPGVVRKDEQRYIVQFPLVTISQKNKYQNNKIKIYHGSKRQITLR